MMFIDLELKIIGTQLVWALGCYLVDRLIRKNTK